MAKGAPGGGGGGGGGGGVVTPPLVAPPVVNPLLGKDPTFLTFLSPVDIGGNEFVYNADKPGDDVIARSIKINSDTTKLIDVIGTATNLNDKVEINNKLGGTGPQQFMQFSGSGDTFVVNIGPDAKTTTGSILGKNIDTLTVDFGDNTSKGGDIFKTLPGADLSASPLTHINFFGGLGNSQADFSVLGGDYTNHHLFIDYAGNLRNLTVGDALAPAINMGVSNAIHGAPAGELDFTLASVQDGFLIDLQHSKIQGLASDGHIVTSDTTIWKQQAAAGHAEDATIVAPSGIISALGSAANDVMVMSDAGGGAVRAGFGNDWIYAGVGGGNKIDGGVLLGATTPAGTDHGNDTASYAHFGASVTIDLDKQIPSEARPTGTVVKAAFQGGAAFQDALQNIDNVEGSRAGDTLIGNADGNHITGLGGGDKLTGTGQAFDLTTGKIAGVQNETGSDVFVYHNVIDSSSTTTLFNASTMDEITDFHAKSGTAGGHTVVADAFDFSNFYVNNAAGNHILDPSGHPTFVDFTPQSWDGTAEKARDGNVHAWAEDAGSNTVLVVDTKGHGLMADEVRIQLDGVKASDLGLANFVHSDHWLIPPM
jgi:hypothetical protein